MIVLGALMRGIAEQMARNGIATLTGHVQVHHRGYRSDPVIENSISAPKEVTEVLKDVLPAQAVWSPRVRVNAVVSNARHTTGITIVGIEPVREAKVSFIGGALSEGRYFSEGETSGIIVGKALVNTFETRLGRKLVVMSQGTDRDIASRAFRIVGIFRAELESTEKQFVFIPLGAAQQMLKLNDHISEVSIVLDGDKNVDEVAENLKKVLSAEHYEVHTWRELLPLVTAYLKLNEVFIYIWFVVVFVAMSFGVVNTTLMAVFERIREFGLLKALGMKPWWIVRGVVTETFFILVIGLVIGNILSFFSVAVLSGIGIDLSALAAGSEYFGISRVIYPVLDVRDFAGSNCVVLFLGLCVSLYPAIKAARFTPVEALAHT